MYLIWKSAEGPKHDTQRYFYTLSQASFACVTTVAVHTPSEIVTSRDTAPGHTHFSSFLASASACWHSGFLQKYRFPTMPGLSRLIFCLPGYFSPQLVQVGYSQPKQVSEYCRLPWSRKLLCFDFPSLQTSHTWQLVQYQRIRGFVWWWCLR